MDKDIYRRMARQEMDHWWFTARREILNKVISNYSPQGDSLNILEAGCGTGGNLHLLGRFGKVCGFELDDEACAKAAKTGVRVVKGKLPDDVPFEKDAFDIIALFDVLEHVEQDRESIQSLFAHLRPGGRLFITVPALPFLWSRHDVRHHHFRRYRKQNLRNLIEDSGFELVRLSHYNFLLSPIVIGTRLCHKLVQNQHSDDEKMPPAWLNHLLFRIFSAEGSLLMAMNLPIGISLIAIAERPRH